ncbi:MAG: membrane protein insertion efficiency factor YidD [Clostridiales bacterium]|nr:MAG: membrane protein insertion efficiency factor YidD [Clostridiales bacterium]
MRKIWILPIRAYQKYISPKIPSRCKFYPTCSAYACTAILRYGILIGGGLAIWRVLRCNPWSRGGYDPVPDLFSKRRKTK